jgi:hypothetical protein
MGPVQRAIRARFPVVPITLHTFGQQKPFELSVIDRAGIVLRLGNGGWKTPLPWECLESIPAFLGRQGGWVRAGGIRSVDGEPGTLDEHLKKCQKRDVARWLVRVLADAAVVDVSVGPPLCIRVHHASAGRVSMSLLRKLRGDAAGTPSEKPSAPSGAWGGGQFARANGDHIEVRFHDAAEAKLAIEQLGDLMGQWQGEKSELAAAKAEEIAKHAAILNELKARQAKIDGLIRSTGGAIARVEAYARRNA